MLQSRSYLVLTAIFLSGSMISPLLCSAALVRWDGGAGGFGNERWSLDDNWDNNSEPSSADDVAIGEHPSAPFPTSIVDKDFTINSLSILQDGIVRADFDLDVTEAITLFEPNTQLAVIGPDVGDTVVSTPSLELRGGSRLILDRFGVVEVEGGDFTIDDVAIAEGSGSIFLDNDGAGNQARLINDGTIRAGFNVSAKRFDFTLSSAPHVFSISSASGSVGSVDLDGTSGDGQVVVGSELGGGPASLIISAPLLDDHFTGEIRVGISSNESILQINQPWTVASGGRLVLADIGSLRGGRLTLDGGIVSASGTFEVPVTLSDGVLTAGSPRFLEEVVLQNSAEILIPASSGIMRLEAQAFFRGGSISGSGLVAINGGLAVQSGAPAVINAQLDWDGDADLPDGSGPTSNTTIEPGGFLRVAGQLPDNDHDGVISINDGTLEVTSGTWVTRNELQLENGAQVRGSRVVVEGDLRAISSGTIEAPVTLTPTADVFVNNADILRFDGETTLAGGSYRGQGTIEQNGNLLVTAPTSIGTNFSLASGALQFWVDTYDLDGADNDAEVQIGHNADFTINAEQLDSVSGNRFGGTITSLGGNLVVNTGVRIPSTVSPGTLLPATVAPAAWQLDGTLNLLSLLGETPVVTTTVGAPLEIIGTVNALSGSAILALPLITFTSGNINVEDEATLILSELVVDNGRFDVDGTLNFGQTTFGPGTRLEIASGGVANLLEDTLFQGGQYQGLGVLRQQGSAIVENDTTISSALVFTSTSSTTIRESVVLAKGTNLIGDTASSIILAGAEFSGKGLFDNREESVVILQDGADVQVDFLNSGELTIGFGQGASLIGEAQFNLFKNTGTSFFDLAGTGADDYDQIVVDTIATLAGTLSVDLFDNFLPTPGDEFQLLTAEIVMGTFDDVLLPSLSGITWELEYKPVSVILRAAVATTSVDTEPDGDVDGADFLALQRSNPSLIPAWLAQYGSTPGLLIGAHQVPEPNALLLVAFSMATLCTLRFSSARPL